MGGVYPARGQDSSVGGGAGFICLGVVHMEEGVQVECGREEVEDGEKHGERQNEDTSNRQSTAHHGWHEDGMSARLQTLEPMQCDVHQMNCANCMRKMTCEVYIYMYSEYCVRTRIAFHNVTSEYNSTLRFLKTGAPTPNS